MKKLNVLFLLNEEKDTSLIITKEIVNYLISKKCLVFVEKQIYNKVPNTLLWDDNSKDKNKQIKIHFSIILGGDGTILNFAQKYKEYDFSYFGINIGRVGCLAEGTTSNYIKKLEQIINGNYYIENRNTILGKLCDNNSNVIDEFIAFNEISIQRGKLYKMLLINMLINGNNPTSFYADGVIVATSTGSSAYSLSSGGPLLLPTAKNFVITPICPQLRTITSLVINDTEEICIDIRDSANREKYDKNKPLIVIDGYKQHEMLSDHKLILGKSNKVLRVIKVNQNASLFEPIYKVAMSTKNLFTEGEKNE